MNRHEIQEDLEQMTVRETTMANLKKAGLPIPPKPEQSDSLFRQWESLKKRFGKMSSIPYSELGEFLDRWTELVGYARWNEAVADIDRMTAIEIRDTIKGQLYMLQEGGRELRAAAVTVEPLYREWEQKYIEASAMYESIRSLVSGYEGRAFSISREITRRGGDMMDGRRQMNRGNQA